MAITGRSLALGCLDSLPDVPTDVVVLDGVNERSLRGVLLWFSLDFSPHRLNLAPDDPSSDAVGREAFYLCVSVRFGGGCSSLYCSPHMLVFL